MLKHGININPLIICIIVLMQKKAKLMIKDGNTTILSFDNLANYLGFKYFNYVTPHNLADAFESFKAITLPDMLKAYNAYELNIIQ